jgi:hypothetical protein
MYAETINTNNSILKQTVSASIEALVESCPYKSPLEKPKDRPIMQRDLVIRQEDLQAGLALACEILNPDTPTDRLTEIKAQYLKRCLDHHSFKPHETIITP